MTELQPECINLYKPDGTEISLQDRIYKTDTVSPALCSSGFRPYYLIGGGYKMSKEVTVFEHRVDEPFRTFNGGVCGTLRTTEACGDKHVLIKENNERGFDECILGGVADFLYPTSKTRRGRVQNGGYCSPTITAENTGVCRIEPNLDDYRIRKLTPRECWRLMGFSDEDFSKAEKVNSNTQLYKQAGNSIVVNCLEGLFSSLL